MKTDAHHPGSWGFILPLILVSLIGIVGLEAEVIDVAHGDANALQNAIDLAQSGDTLRFTRSPTRDDVGHDYDVRGVITDKNLTLIGDGEDSNGILPDVDIVLFGDLSIPDQVPELHHKGGVLQITGSSIVTIEDLNFFEGHANHGGVISYEGHGRLIVRNCLFEDCRAELSGGAISFEGTQDVAGKRLEIEGCVFESNISHDGGAIHVSAPPVQTFPTILLINGNSGARTFFYGNEAELDGVNPPRGGAIFSEGVRTIVAGADLGNGSFGVEFTQNMVAGIGPNANKGIGGAIAVKDDSLVVVGADIVDNHSDGVGGGVSIQSDHPGMRTLRIQSGTLISENSATDGGGLFVRDPELQLLVSSTTLTDNTASNDGGGALIQEAGSGSFLNSFEDSQITGNSAGGHGGGVVSYSPNQLSFSGTSLLNNEAGDSGGGIFAQQIDELEPMPSIILNGSQLTGNEALLGGGIATDSAKVDIFNTGFNENIADGSGGAIHGDESELNFSGDADLVLNRAGSNGGALDFSNSIVNFSEGNQSLTDNHALQDGGAIFSQSTLLDFSSVVEISGNTANFGGGLFVDGDEQLGTVTNTANAASIFGNTAVENGGGIFDSGTLVLEDFVFATDGNQPNQIFRDFGDEFAMGVTNPVGVEVFNQSQEDLGSWLVDSTGAPLRFRIFNDGGEALQVFAISISGPDADDFVLDRPHLQKLPEVVESSTTFSVSLSPTSLGSKSATLTIISSDPDDIFFEFDLIATGTSIVVPAPMGEYLKASNTGANDFFGQKVAIDGNTIVAGAPTEDSNLLPDENVALSSGAAYVFVSDETAGQIVQQAILKASNLASQDTFGSAVAISGDTIVVGALGEDSASIDDPTDNSVSSSGAAYVFVRDPRSLAWKQRAYLKASNPLVTARFGSSVAISGDTIVIGAPLESAPFFRSGAAYVFVRDAAQQWTQLARLEASNSTAGDQFGSSVSISGDLIVVGACLEDGRLAGVDQDSANNFPNSANNTASNAGAAYVFRRGQTSFVQEAYLKASNAATNDQFGTAVGVSRDTVVVSALLEDGEGDSFTNRGAAYVFHLGENGWSEQNMLEPELGDSGDRFGFQVSISGDVIAIGADKEDSSFDSVHSDPNNFGSQENDPQEDNQLADSGATYLFIRENGVWRQNSYIKAPFAGAGDNFGAVALSGRRIVVGAVREDSIAEGVNGDASNNSAPNSGAAYLFEIIGDDDIDGLPTDLELALGFDPNRRDSVRLWPLGGDLEMFNRLRLGAEPVGIWFQKEVTEDGLPVGSYGETGFGSYNKPSPENVSRFLAQGSWGSSLQKIEKFLTDHGNDPNPYESWIDEQIKMTFNGEVVEEGDPFSQAELKLPIETLANVALVGPDAGDAQELFDLLKDSSETAYPDWEFWHSSSDDPLEDIFDEDLVEVSGNPDHSRYPDNYVRKNPGRLKGYVTSSWARRVLDSVDLGNPSLDTLFKMVRDPLTGTPMMDGDVPMIANFPNDGLNPVVNVGERGDNLGRDNPSITGISTLPGIDAPDLGRLGDHFSLLVNFRLATGDPASYLTSSGLCSGTYIGYMHHDDDRLRLRPRTYPLIYNGFRKSATSEYLNKMTTPFPVTRGEGISRIASAWMSNAIHGENELRQRMTFALSQIFVVSMQDAAIANATKGFADYYDILAENAFGNYLDIMRHVTRHPVMGHYLTHINSGIGGGAAPDENYARELLQLFTIGLDELEIDGTPTLSGGKPIPTYDSTDIQELAKVFTGLHARGRDFGESIPNDWENIYFELPMVIEPNEHDYSTKSALGGLIDFEHKSVDPNIKMSRSAGEAIFEINTVLSQIYSHRNVAPFVAQRLIQHFVKSNPSPDYVERVARVFNQFKHADDQLAHVIRAILLDQEARDWEKFLIDPDAGKLKSPVLRTMQVAKALNAGKHIDPLGQPVPGRHYPAPTPENAEYTFTGDVQWNSLDGIPVMGQLPLFSRSVFNFFQPGYVPPEFSDDETPAPEFQILDSVTAISTPGELFRYVSEQGQVEGQIDSAYKDIKPFGTSSPRRHRPFGNFNGFQRLDTTPWTTGETDMSEPGRRFVSDPDGALSINLGDVDFDAKIEAYLDEINVLFAHGRLSASTRKTIKETLSDAKNSSDAQFLNTLGIQILVASPDAVILK